MQWDDLKVFLAVARAGAISGAGRTLRLDPATIGRRIARLEQAGGTALFAKSPQGYQLTVEGQRLVTHAEAAEQAVIAASASLRDEAGRLSGQVRIGAPDGCANYLLPQVCRRIAEANPELEIQIVAQPRVANLSKREADLAIAVSPPSAGRLTVQKITDYHLHLAAHQDYLAEHAPILQLEDLGNHRIVGYIQDMITDPELDYLAAAGLGAPKQASNSVPVQLHLIQARAGVGIVHDFALASVPDVVRVLPEQFSLTRSFFLLRHADDRRVARMTQVAEALVEGVRAEVQRLEAGSLN